MIVKNQAEILSKFKKKVFFQGLIFSSICLALTACPKPEPPPPTTKYHFYIVLSPINQEQVTQATAFLTQAKGKVDKKAQIIAPGNRYTIAKFCEKDTPEFPTPGIELPDDKAVSMQAVTGEAEKVLAQISTGQITCKASAASLVNLAPYLNDATSKYPEKMIVLIQAPWNLTDVDKVFPKIKDGMDKLAQSGKVEKIILFGVNDGAANQVATAFQQLNQDGNRRAESPATSVPQTLTYLKKIHSDVLKLN